MLSAFRAKDSTLLRMNVSSKDFLQLHTDQTEQHGFHTRKLIKPFDQYQTSYATRPDQWLAISGGLINTRLFRVLMLNGGLWAFRGFQPKSIPYLDRLRKLARAFQEPLQINWTRRSVKSQSVHRIGKIDEGPISDLISHVINHKFHWNSWLRLHQGDRVTEGRMQPSNIIYKDCTMCKLCLWTLDHLEAVKLLVPF